MSSVRRGKEEEIDQVNGGLLVEGQSLTLGLRDQTVALQER